MILLLLYIPLRSLRSSGISSSFPSRFSAILMNIRSHTFPKGNTLSLPQRAIKRCSQYLPIHVRSISTLTRWGSTNFSSKISDIFMYLAYSNPFKFLRSSSSIPIDFRKLTTPTANSIFSKFSSGSNLKSLSIFLTNIPSESLMAFSLYIVMKSWRTFVFDFLSISNYLLLQIIFVRIIIMLLMMASVLPAPRLLYIGSSPIKWDTSFVSN